MIFGYAAWYRWGFASLPFLAAAAALHLLFRTFVRAPLASPQAGSSVAIGKAAVAVLALVYTFYLFYWNILSIHYA